MTAGTAANILTIYDKVVRLISEKPGAPLPVTFKTPLQTNGPRDLGWSDAAQQAFLDGPIYEMFRVRVEAKQLRPVINGSVSTVGDLVIAIHRVIHKQQRPRKRPVSTDYVAKATVTIE
jgi:hypothetical protein